MNARLRVGIIVFILGFAVFAAGSMGIASTLIQASLNEAQTLVQPEVQVFYAGSNQPTTIPNSNQAFTVLSVVDSSGTPITAARCRFTITVTLSTNDQSFSGATNVQWSGSATVSATGSSTSMSGSTQGTVSYSSPIFTYQTGYTEFAASQMFSGTPANGAQSVITWPLSITATLTTPTGAITKTASASATFTAQWKTDTVNTYAVSINVTPSTSTSTTTSTQSSTSTSTSTTGGPLTVRQVALGGYCIAWSPAINVHVGIIPYGSGTPVDYGTAPASYAGGWCFTAGGLSFPVVVVLTASGYSEAQVSIFTAQSVVRLSIFDVIQSPTAYPEFILYAILMAVGAGIMVMSVPMFRRRKG